ncbi:MAG: hypothetical protein LBJ99_04750 [Oscillospiraceae bacterium]|jgi:hypothetical protein|nr:hypothetical protein [Oscillospiraceae bacterium]
MEKTITKTNIERLAERYAKVPRIEETGPQKGCNGRRMAKKGAGWRAVHAAACVVGLLPLVLKLAGAAVEPWLIAAGLGLVVPGGGLMAAGGALTMPLGVGLCFWLWRKRGMRILDIYGSVVGVFGFWLLGALGGLLTLVKGTPVDFLFAIPPYWWGYILAAAAAVVLFGDYERRVRKMYAQMTQARAQRVGALDEAVRELDEIMERYSDDSPRELSEDQLRAERYLLEAAVRDFGDFSKFDHFKVPVLTDNRYQFSVVGMALMVLQAKYLPNFHGYLKHAREFCINAVTDPRTCGYWAKTSLIGYWKWNPDPINHSNIMLSGWMLPMIASFGEQFGDRKYEAEGALKFQPFADKPDKTYDYSVKGVVEALYKQLNSKMYPYMYIPCEPHVAFPTCNSYGLLGMLIYDRDHGTHYMEDIWDDLYDNLSSEFVEIEGSIALRRQYIFGLRHMPASQIGYDPLADVQNYLHYAPLFPGLCKRAYALIRKYSLELREGVAYIKGKKWEEVFDMATLSFNPALVMSQLEMVATEYGDTEMVEGLRRAEEIYLERSMDPKILKWKNVPVVVSAFLSFAHLARKGDWTDIILRGPDETAKTGPILADCAFPEVMVAKASSGGDDLELVLYNGEEPGEYAIRLGRLKPETAYTVAGTDRTFNSDVSGEAELTVHIDGRTPVHITPAA